MFSVSVVWCLWGIDVYLVQCAPHWGQRETLLAYYEKRVDRQTALRRLPDELEGRELLHRQSGTGVRLLGTEVQGLDHRPEGKGVTTMYFTTEHGRAQSLKSEIGEPKTFEAITTPELNNKFFIAKVTF